MTKVFTVREPYRRCPAVRPYGGQERCIRREGHEGLHTCWVKGNPLKIQLVQFLANPEEGDGGGDESPL